MLCAILGRHIGPIATAEFSRFADANRWAMGYAKGSPKACTASVINNIGTVSAQYVSDGKGAVTSDWTSVGTLEVG